MLEGSANSQQEPEYYVEEYLGLAGQPLDAHGSHQENPGLAYALWELKMSFLP